MTALDLDLAELLGHRLDKARAAASDSLRALGMAEIALAADEPDEAAAYLTQALHLTRAIVALEPAPDPGATPGQRALFDSDVGSCPPTVDEAVGNRPGLAHRFGPSTSDLAALANAARAGTQRRRVLEALAAAPEGRTDAELEARLDLARPSPGNRRGELVALGLVIDTGGRRPTRTGCTAVVWALTEMGRDLVAELHRLEQMRAES